MGRQTPARQSVSAKKAESERPFIGEDILRNRGPASMYRQRAVAVLVDLAVLGRQGVRLNPFLEIGAGSVQRSAAIINNYPVEGAAVDISQGSLQNAPYVLRLLGYDRAPLLVCCDSHHQPFLSDTFQFVFAYRTLHHFDDPIPVVAECYRVLGRGGHFYFNEEPMDSPFRRLLRGKRMLSHPPTGLQELAYRLGVAKVFWDDGAAERSRGITEARFDIGVWRRALETFGVVDVVVNRRLKMHSDLRRTGLQSFLPGFIGGNVRGLCTKTDGQAVTGRLRERLMCLDCGSNRLKRAENAQLVCQECGRSYPATDGVVRMLPEELETHLHPE